MMMMMILIPCFMAMALFIVALMMFFMPVIFVFFRFCVVVLDWNLNNERFHVKLVWNLFKDVDFIWNSDFFNHWHFDFLNDRVLLDVMMVDCVNPLRFFMFLFAVGNGKDDMKMRIEFHSLQNLLLFFVAAINHRNQHRENHKFLRIETFD